MTCQGINATLSLYMKIIDEQNKRVFRMFILTILLIVVIMIEASYIVYDIKKDSEFEIETTVTEVYQDSTGNDTYIDGNGVILNGATSKENNQIKR